MGLYLNIPYLVLYLKFTYHAKKGVIDMVIVAIYAFIALILAVIIYGAVKRAINDSELTYLTQKKVQLLQDIKNLLDQQQADKADLEKK